MYTKKQVRARALLFDGVVIGKVHLSGYTRGPGFLLFSAPPGLLVGVSVLPRFQLQSEEKHNVGA